MDDEIDWDARAGEVTGRLTPLMFLVGDWEGEGDSHGAVVRGRLEVKVVLGGSFLEARETIFDAKGALDHEDLCLYRFDPKEGLLRVTQYLPPAWVEHYGIEVLPTGAIRWVTGPLGPRVQLHPMDPDHLEVRVWLPLQAEPAHVLRYARA